MYGQAGIYLCQIPRLIRSQIGKSKFQCGIIINRIGATFVIHQNEELSPTGLTSSIGVVCSINYHNDIFPTGLFVSGSVLRRYLRDFVCPICIRNFRIHTSGWSDHWHSIFKISFVSNGVVLDTFSLPV